MAFLFSIGCSGGIGGCGCGEEQLPSWDYIPVDQQVEGGGQVRVTPNGFNKLTSLIPAVINDTLGAGITIPRNQVVDAGIAEATICNGGCLVDINVDSVNMSVPANDRLNVRAQFDVNAPINIDYEVFWVISGSCTATATLNNAVFDVDLTVGIDPTDGELTLGVGNINNLDLTGIGLSGCGGIADIVGSALSLFANLLNSALGNLIINLVRPLIEDLVQGFLPDPLGLNHKIDLGALVSGLSPGTNAVVEFRGVPGGYAALKSGGMSLGLITGFNADEDEATRTPELDSEAALCVPPLPSVNFAAAPHNLPIHPTRGTFALKAASEFDGAPDPSAELAIGISETTLDLVGHHAVTSGVMCLGVGTSLVEQLNLGLIGILVPSLAELGSDDGSDPLLLVLRPQTALDFTVGEGTDTDPSLTIGIRDLEVDFYAFLYGRYVRGFTISLTMNVGINLEFTTDMNGAPAIMPTLTGLDTDMIELTVLNSEFLREDAATLEQVLPTIFDLAIPLITDGLGAFTLPDFAGFSLTNMSINKVTTTEDDFLAIFANLGQVVSPKLIGLADQYPSLGAKLAELAPVDDGPVFRVQTRASLASVHAPAPAVIRAALAGSPDGKMTTITIDVPATDELGRELEHTWSIRNGIRHPFQKGGQLVLTDPAFAMQGRHQINVQSRVVGDFRTHDTDGVDLDLVIDSVGPRIFAERASIDGGQLIVPASDLVSAPETLRFQFGRPGDDTRWTDWVESISIDDAVAMADAAKHLRVWAKDELGNESETTLDLGPVINFHGTAGGDGGCNCDAGATDTRTGAGMALLALFTLGLLLRPRKALARVRGSRAARSTVNALPFVFAVAAMTLVSACSCGGDPGGDLTCEIDEDCVALCPDNTIPICFDNQCVCADDVPYGRIGQHSDMAVSSNGSAWVSGYNSSHGDLMAARWPSEGPIPNQEWSFIDGVPDGPVVLPQSDVRNGVFDPGPNVGQYTSIAVKPDDSVDIAYFDVDTGSLKFASNASGAWIIHTVEAGAGMGDPELGYTVVGKYTSITVRSDDGRPGIAYLAEIGDGAGNITTEVRYAAAQSATPGTSTDWNVWVVDTVTVPAPTAEMPDVLNLPMGVGLFIDSTRLSDETPVIVYYDRINGDLKLARFDAVAGTFQAPTIVDDGARDGNTDVGWYPSVAADMNDDLHMTYVSATNDDLYYINTIDNLPTIVDDGYRIVGQTNDGLPKPEFHFVGDDSSIIVTNVGPVVVYQDATSHELLLANINNVSEWEHQTIAGSEDPFEGGYGFYAAAARDGDQVVMSTWVIDQPLNAVWVEIFRRMVVIE